MISNEVISPFSTVIEAFALVSPLSELKLTSVYDPSLKPVPVLNPKTRVPKSVDGPFASFIIPTVNASASDMYKSSPAKYPVPLVVIAIDVTILLSTLIVAFAPEPLPAKEDKATS